MVSCRKRVQGAEKTKGWLLLECCGSFLHFHYGTHKHTCTNTQAPTTTCRTMCCLLLLTSQEHSVTSNYTHTHTHTFPSMSWIFITINNECDVVGLCGYQSTTILHIRGKCRALFGEGSLKQKNKNVSKWKEKGKFLEWALNQLIGKSGH